jgi:hypothetical protein
MPSFSNSCGGTEIGGGPDLLSRGLRESLSLLHENWPKISRTASVKCFAACCFCVELFS